MPEPTAIWNSARGVWEKPGGGADAVPPLRALGAVLGDLADLGFDADWTVVRASDIGAPHQRSRVFVLAWPAADAPHLGHERRGRAWGGRGGPANRSLTALDTAGVGRRTTGQQCGLGATQRGEVAVADALGVGRGEGRPEPARIVRRPDASLGGRATASDPEIDTRPQGDPHRTATAGRRGDAAPDTDGGGRRAGQPVDAEREPDPSRGGDRFDWSGTPYAAAVGRWERVLGRPAPSPVDDRGRLAARFAEWMMGLPAGWVTDVPGIPRNAQLKCLGNGVVPQQGAHALRLLLAEYEAANQPPAESSLIRNGAHQQAAIAITCGDSGRAA